MGVHDDVAQARVVGQCDGDGWRLRLRVPGLFQDLTHGGQVRRLGLECPGQGIVECACAVEIEQFGQPGGGGAEIAVALGQRSKEGGSIGAGMMQAIEPAVMARGTFEGNQIRDVLDDLDLFALAPATRVSGDDLCPVNHAHAFQGGVHLHAAAHVGVRYRVVVQI